MSQYVETIPFTPDVMFHGKRLMIAGLMPNGRNDQDAFIVQSLIGFCAERKRRTQSSISARRTYAILRLILRMAKATHSVGNQRNAATLIILQGFAING